MLSLVLPHIQAMAAYHPPLEGRVDKDYLLLDFNERTLPPPAFITEAIHAFLAEQRLHIYPSYGNFLEKLAGYTTMPSANLMLTNGSDHGIELLIRSLTTAGNIFLQAKPTFAIYAQVAQSHGLKIIETSYSLEKGFPLEETIALLQKQPVAMVCIVNPNNPTGTLLPRADIINLLQSFPETAFLVDECYYEYSQETVQDVVEKFPNLFITRTFSKTWGLSGLRLGYIISSKNNIEHLLKVRGPYDVNMIAVKAAEAALAHPAYMQEYVQDVMFSAKPLFERFLTEHSMPFWPSGGNFVLFYSPHHEKTLQQLTAAAILGRPRVDANNTPCLRLTIGTTEQMHRVCTALSS